MKKLSTSEALYRNKIINIFAQHKIAVTGEVKLHSNLSLKLLALICNYFLSSRNKNLKMVTSLPYVIHINSYHMQCSM